VVAAALVVVAQVATSTLPAAAATSEPYNWKNVRIDGGGFVPGIIFNPSEQNLIYARTDIGGAYRWNQTNQSWIPLLDWVGWSNWGWNGVESLATDPVQTNRVYAAVGMYTNTWDPNNGAILRSTDKGATWQSFSLPFKVGGNMPGRAMGERLAVDPNNNANVYYGASNGNGLWRSTNFGQTFTRVTSFTNVGNYSEDPNDANGYLSHRPGVVWVAFDKSSGTPGNTTQGIYVGVADLQNTIYRSTNGGSTWERLAGQPTGFMAHQGEVVGGTLYITTSMIDGPYDGQSGQVWKYAISTGTWTNITPPTTNGSAVWYGFAGLSIDKQQTNTIMVTGYSSWWPDTFIFRSTNGGSTWRSIWDFPGANGAQRTNHYSLNISSVPWLTFNDQKSLPEEVPKLGWMTEALEIDPFNSNRMMYGTGAIIYGTTNMTALDTGGTVNIAPMVRGLEETAIGDLVSPPSGAANLFSGMLDIGGFRHTNLDAVPGPMYNNPFFGATTSIDFAQSNPMWMVRVGRTDRSGATNIAYSTDAGANWFQGSAPGGADAGTVAMNANNSRVVWSTEDVGVWFSTSVGGGFSQSSGIPAGAKVEADRVNANKFYGYANGTFYVSTNGGQSFTAAATGLGGSGDSGFKALPGVDGEIWLVTDTGVYRSTNSGTSFTKFAVSSSGVGIGFGAPAPGRTNPAVYTMATIDGVRGVYRSNDVGVTWVRINDDQHQYGNAGAAITGDPRVYGRVYLGTNGRGALYADPTGAPPTTPPADTTPPTVPGQPSASSITQTTATLTWTASTDSGGSGLAGYNIYRRQGTTDTLFTTSTTNSANLTGLTASTAYSFVIRARDNANNLSNASTAGNFTTAGTGGGCSATYTKVNEWPGGFSVDVRVTNNGTTPTTSWTVTWAFPNGQTITQIWGGIRTQTGANVTVTPESWDAVIQPSQSITFGFNGAWSGTNNAPATVTCTRTP
jgi:hypothetical protein